MNTQQRPQNIEPKQHWCKIHPLAFWMGDYKQCRQGFLRNEKCERGDIEEVKEDDK